MSMGRKALAESLRAGKYTSVGCYPKFWLAADGETVSYDAIMADARLYLGATGGREGLGREYVIVACDINWEDPDMVCAATGNRIESAYAEPES